MKLKRLTQVVLLSFTMSTFVVGCSDENENNNPITTTETEVTTQEQTTTKEVETTTEEPTTTKEVETKTIIIYEYLSKGMVVDRELKDYFDGLTLKKGDVIYLNELYPDESSEYDTSRGALAYSLLKHLQMKDEREVFEKEYWPEGAYVAEVPYKKNIQ